MNIKNGKQKKIINPINNINAISKSILKIRRGNSVFAVDYPNISFRARYFYNVGFRSQGYKVCLKRK